MVNLRKTEKDIIVPCVYSVSLFETKWVRMMNISIWCELCLYYVCNHHTVISHHIPLSLHPSAKYRHLRQWQIWILVLIMYIVSYERKSFHHMKIFHLINIFTLFSLRISKLLCCFPLPTSPLCICTFLFISLHLKRSPSVGYNP